MILKKAKDINPDDEDGLCIKIFEKPDYTNRKMKSIVFDSDDSNMKIFLMK